jgi:hypothetical protein
MHMMNNETIDAIMKHDGYEIVMQHGQYHLFDLVGKFVDSTHATREALNAHVEKHIAPHVGSDVCSLTAQGWAL